MAMPQYFFDVRSQEFDYRDSDGITLADGGAAIAYAERMIRELKEDEGYEAPDLEMFVKDAFERAIITIRFNPPKIRTVGESSAVAPMRIK
jgi:hypothetical protein